MNYILSLLLTVSLLSTNFPFVNNNIPDRCKRAIKEAKRDYTENKLKYYTFGIASFPKQEIKMNIGSNIEVISLGCMINTYQICYNQYVDSLLVTKTGVNFHDQRK